jgi:hypothetical protein
MRLIKSTSCFLIILFGSFGLAKSSEAATINAASCSQSDVQGAIANAQDGDTVSIPAGSCTWTSAVGWSNKNISLIGAGIGNTVITNGIADPYSGVIGVGNASKSSFRISGMTIIQGSLSDGIHVSSTGSSNSTKGWRIDHIRFYSTGNPNSSIYFAGINWGVIDNCLFEGAGWVAVYVRPYIDAEYPYSTFSAAGDHASALPLNMGTDEAVYIEDCTYNFTSMGAVLDGEFGARAVIRYNNIAGTYIQTHSARMGGRGSVSYEIYNNVMDGKNSQSIWVPIWLRSGTGVIFNNTISNYMSNMIAIDDQRTFESSIYSQGAWYRCDGHVTAPPGVDGDLGSGNQAGWPCLDQIGWYGPYANQKNVPLYAWNNGAVTIGLANDQSGNHPWVSDHIKTVNDSNPHPGNVVDYINNGTIPKPGYVPYIYPHPLRGTTDTTSPAAPTALTVN